MTVIQTIDDILAGRLRSRTTHTEAEWYTLYQSENLAAMMPALSALRGGVLSDRLAWVFISGYQAVIRKTFPGLPKQGWLAFAASEDKNNPDQFPGTAIDRSNGTVTLSGHKSWVAQSKNLDHILVTAAGACYLLPTAAAGLSLTHRDQSAFLDDMSQGFAHFDTVDLSDARRFPKARIKSFLQSEAKFVMLAAAGFLLSHCAPSVRQLHAELLGLCLALGSACERANISPQVLAELDILFQAAVERVVELGVHHDIPNWDVDSRLLTMYSKTIQKRAGR